MILEKFQIPSKSRLLIISLIALSLNVSGQARNLSAHIFQGDSVYNVLQLDSIVLKRKAFKYLVGFPKEGNIRLHHSYNDSLFQLFKGNKIKEIEYWSAYSMAETSFNVNKELILNTNGWSCWFYDEELDFHRLDTNSIHKKGAMTFGTKSVGLLHDVDSQMDTKVKKAKKPIYVIIAQESIKNEDKVKYFHCCKIVFKR